MEEDVGMGSVPRTMVVKMSTGMVARNLVRTNMRRKLRAKPRARDEAAAKPRATYAGDVELILTPL
jgi:hypothetical protein